MPECKSYVTEDVAIFAEKLAKQVAPLALRYFRQDLKIEDKRDSSPVTCADREIEKVLRREISTHFPADTILGEEYGIEAKEGVGLWVVDPIDGTKSFITGAPNFGTLIAYCRGNRPDVGVISCPASDEIWVGQRGVPTVYNGAPCRVSTCKCLADARLYTTSPDGFDREELRKFEAVSRLVKLRRFGGDCYSYGLLASGHIDVVLETNLEPYDFLALVPVVEGAGGVITDWRGGALAPQSSGRVLASATPELHERILSHL